MRGCSDATCHQIMEHAVFPAYAGMFLTPPNYHTYTPRFPRVCGDVPWSARRLVGPYAFSPRMRGCSGKSGKIPTHSHVFPAYAGMFHAVGGAREGDNGFPRVCGDVPSLKKTSTPTLRFSPRMRGCSSAEPSSRNANYVFPAYAGMFLSVTPAGILILSFPRVCGDVPSYSTFTDRHSLFSPRMRGCS